MENLSLFPEYDLQPRRRRVKPLAYSLTPSDIELLKAVYHCRFITAEQLIRYRGLSSKSLTWMQEKLKILSGNDEKHPCVAYLQRFYQARYDPRGSLPFVYALANPGKKVLHEIGLDVSVYERIKKVTSRLPHEISHHLSVNEFLIAARHLETYEPRITLVEAQHDWQLKHTPLKVKLFREQGQTQQVVNCSFVSDGLFEFQVDLGDRIAPKRIFLEMDMDTHERHEFKKKIAAYIEFFASGAYVRTFGDVRNVVVLYATPTGEKRRDEMRKWTQEQFERPLYTPASEYLGGPMPGKPDYALFQFLALPKGGLDPVETFLKESAYLLFGNRPQSVFRFPVRAQS